MTTTGPKRLPGSWFALALDRRATAALATAVGTLVAFAIRLWGLGEYGFWYDEGFSATMAALSPQALMATVTTDVHPPLYYFLLKGWMGLAGNGEFALRFLSLLAGVVSVVLTAKIARALAGDRAAALTGAVAAMSPLLVAYSRETRMYVFAGLWVTLAACLLILALRRPRQWLWVAFATAEAAALWTHYYTGLVLLALGLVAAVYFLVRRPDRRAALAWALTQVAVLASIAPIVQPALARLGNYGSNFLAPTQPAEVAITAWKAFFFGLRASAGDDLLLLVASGLVAGIATILALTRRETRLGAIVALVWIGVATVPVLYAGAQRAAFHPRYLLQVVPAFSLLVGLGLSRGGRLQLPSGVAALVLAGLFGLGLATGAVTAREDAGSVARYLASVATERDVILVDTDEPFRYYATRSPAPYVIMPEEYPGDANLRGWLDRVSPGRERIFHLQWLASFYDPREVIKYYLRSQTDWLGERRFAGFVVDAYRVPSTYDFSPPKFEKTAHAFGGAIELAGAQLAPGRDVLSRAGTPSVVSDGLLPVVLNWRGKANPGFDLGAGVVLVDDAGRTVSSVVRPLFNAAHVPSSRWAAGEEAANYYLLPVPAGTLPGLYTVRAFTFRDGTAQRLDVLDARGSPTGTEVEVGKLQVVSPSAAGRMVPPPATVRAEFGELALVTTTLDRGQVFQGDRLAVDLHWWAREKPRADYGLELTLVTSSGGEPAARSYEDIAAGRYPTSTWPAGERAQERRWLLLPGRAAEGTYTLRARLIAKDGRGAGVVELGTVDVKAMSRRFDVPAIPRPAPASFGATIELLGFDVDAERLTSTHPLRLTLYWRSLAATEVDYTVFTHLLGPGDVVWGQQDKPPLDGTRPTAGWLPGEVLVDRYDLTLRPGSPAGEYTLEVGLYDATTMARLAVVDASGRPTDSRVVLLHLPLER